MPIITRRLSPAITFTACRFKRIAQWHQLWHSRRALARLEARMLDDLGVSRIDALREAAKPFWRR